MADLNKDAKDIDPDLLVDPDYNSPGVVNNAFLKNLRLGKISTPRYAIEITKQRQERNLLQENESMSIDVLSCYRIN